MKEGVAAVSVDKNRIPDPCTHVWSEGGGGGDDQCQIKSLG